MKDLEVIKHLKSNSTEDIIFDEFVNKVKTVFYDKYALNLRRLDIELFELDGIFYVYDVKELVFEKYDSNFIKLRCERLLNNFQEKHKYKNLSINRKAANIKEIGKFLFTMNDIYEDAKARLNLNQYIEKEKKDDTSDNVFRQLRPNCPYSFTQLLNEKIDKKTFAKHASVSLWKPK